MHLFDKTSITAFNDTDYLQIMSVATKVVLDNFAKNDGVNMDDFDFSLMYTPMNTGSFKDYGSDGLSILFCMMFECTTIVIAMFLSQTRE